MAVHPVNVSQAFTASLDGFIRLRDPYFLHFEPSLDATMNIFSLGGASVWQLVRSGEKLLSCYSPIPLPLPTHSKPNPQ